MRIRAGLIILIFVASSTLSTLRVQADTPFADGFDAYPTGTFPGEWQLIFNGNGDADQYITNSISHSPPNSLHLRGRPGGCWEAMAARPFTSNSPRIRVTASLRVEQLNLPPGCGSAAAILGFSHPSGVFGNYVAPVVVASNGTVIVSGIWTQRTLSAGVWYEISLLLDKKNNVTTLSIDGGNVGSFPAAPLEEMDRISMVSLTSGHTGPDVDFDDVVVGSEVEASTPSVSSLPIGFLLLLGGAAGASGLSVMVARQDERSRPFFPFFALVSRVRRKKAQEALDRLRAEVRRRGVVR